MSGMFFETQRRCSRQLKVVD